MGKKYIIEIGRLERLYKAFVSAHGKAEITWLSPEVDLTPYTEPDLEQVRKEGYAQGLVDGNGVRKSEINTAYQRGAEDMREALRLLIDCDDDCLTIPDVFKLFGEGSYHAVVRNHPAVEILEKIRQYEQEKTKVEYNFEEVKDVIETTAKEYNMSLDEIAAVLEKMRGEQDG